MATIDTANARIAQMVTLGPEALLFMVAFVESSALMVSDELISCGLYIREMVNGMRLSGSTKPDIRMGY